MRPIEPILRKLKNHVTTVESGSIFAYVHAAKGKE
jgi:hypothetical protein